MNLEHATNLYISQHKSPCISHKINGPMVLITLDAMV